MKNLFATCLCALAALSLQAHRAPYYPLTPVPSSAVTLTDDFWKSKIETACSAGLDWTTGPFDREGGGYRIFRESSRRDTVLVKPEASFENDQTGRQSPSAGIPPEFVATVSETVKR